MNATEREKRLDLILDEVIEKEVEDFRRESFERRKAEQQEAKTEDQTKRTTSVNVK